MSEPNSNSLAESYTVHNSYLKKNNQMCHSPFHNDLALILSPKTTALIIVSSTVTCNVLTFKNPLSQCDANQEKLQVIFNVYCNVVIKESHHLPW